ncbi:ADP-ribose pyrophosphatase YjhB, NUDIX family [Kordiimonas lacus]|jgi:ADP-ribose pyrophosphatase YjhB (NUDIX family)|uniref:ADP-ribose pyrophosphatase YjhB, NUDIX family n=2 Tax=Kordiimonadaceae TaxID=1331809 RepID=A0A1G7DEW1_9PROT|nr:ADP-ribose pyrophosphatase YjhB, NUDIX family [Kordiimonas lacus]
MTEASEKPDHRQNPTRPVVGVGAVVMNGNNVLLIKRGKPPKENEWSLPGGAQLLGETAFEAAAREVFEETGLTIQPTCLLDVVDYIDRAPDGSLEFHYTLIDYLALTTDRHPVAGTDAVDARFFPLEEALALPLWAETRRIIALAAEKLATL